MFTHGFLDRILQGVKRFIPRRFFRSISRVYHPLLAWSGALWYRFPSRSLKVIGITGTKGKSSVVFLTSAILEASGLKVAAIGSLGYKIREREWPNTLKMTMPGRWKLQRFLREAVRAGCTHVIMEAPSEGLAQGRHLGISFDCAVFTNLHPEHIEAHGSFERYRNAKGILFQATKQMHVINADDASAEYFASFPAQKKLYFGMQGGELRASNVIVHEDRSSFSVYGTQFDLKIGGQFNVYNALAALSIAAVYGVDLPTAKPALESVIEIPGRLQWIQKAPFGVVVDYAHTPDSLRAVYETLRKRASRLIAVLGAAGGGRDSWKRGAFGEIAAEYCDRIVLTDEDPYEESPDAILDQVCAGIPESRHSSVRRILNRKEAIFAAISEAGEGDIVVITGKGSETSMALADGRVIPWSDVAIVRDALHKE